jgi:hypothetical protein
MDKAAIAKRTAYFYAEGAVPEHSPAAFIQTESRPRRLQTPPQWRTNRQMLGTRRRTQLRRFFPVTLEQLRLDPNFHEVRALLAEKGYGDWQIRQAVCNKNWRRRIGASPDSAAEDEVTLIQTLSATFEPAHIFSSKLDLGIDQVEEQINADTNQLLDYMGISGSAHDRQLELKEHGLLDE